MCGIIGAVASRDVANILLDGLHRLEYRGYDSAGMVVLSNGAFRRIRKPGKVGELSKVLNKVTLAGKLGIAHTRWATHGVPTENNAHPHISNDRVAVVHNGIIENFEELKAQQIARGTAFTSETDTEIIAHQIVFYLQQGNDFLAAVGRAMTDLEGAYALGIIDKNDPQKLVAARKGSPLVIGVGENENFITSDMHALLRETRDFIFLENGDIAEITCEAVNVFDQTGTRVPRKRKTNRLSASMVEKGGYPHYMLKEIYEQPQAIADTLEGRLVNGHIARHILTSPAEDVWRQTRAIQIVACGTSYHAGLIARFWFEEFAHLPCFVDVASEFRYRKHIVQPGTLLIMISQSGETADVLAVLQQTRQEGYIASLVVCNTEGSSLVRETDLAMMTHAGPEIGVASTKAFTTQLVALLMLVITAGRHHGLHDELEKILVEQLVNLSTRINQVLELGPEIKKMAEYYGDRQHALFLGRGIHYPVAMEGALKLKEVSYIHAEAYPAGELKHGPIALVDGKIPVIAVAPNDLLLKKLKSNIEEVRARGGVLHVFADVNTGLSMTEKTGAAVLGVNAPEDAVAPIIFSVPLQLLAYHVAVLKGTDVDQPRNLAKSVTVE